MKSKTIRLIVFTTTLFLSGWISGNYYIATFMGICGAAIGVVASKAEAIYFD
ncbi:hypothetical protein [Burkholderia cepacia]|uniref:hypothetical protein n=1 Tax=Burkholderia cepacia TaxID=292 RepID=UPI00298F4AAC|nr:hypothetical protein [Burkholderia cepacia]